MDMDTIQIFNAMMDSPKTDYEMLLDAYGIVHALEDHSLTGKLSSVLQREITVKVHEKKYEEAGNLKDLFYRLMRWDAPTHFESFLIAMEFDRAPNARFYLPRKRVLKPIADDLQRLADKELRELFISLPPRTGKSGLSTFYTAWLVGRDPEQSNLYVTYTNSIAGAFYDGVMEVIDDPYTYHWSEIFPEKKIVFTNAKDGTFDVDRKKKYHSLTTRSLYGTLNGGCNASGVIILDDLLSGYEEAVSPQRLQTAWATTDNNALTRQTATSSILWIGTRWSIQDPIGRRIDLLEHSKQYKNVNYKVYNTPALNKDDESNFVYDFDCGFSSEYFRQRRASFENNNDSASFFAQYQGEPIEREGTVFTLDDFRTFNGELPNEDPDRKFLVIDPAFGGGDYTAGVVCYMYGDDVYVVDVIYSDLDKSYTQPMIAQKVEDWEVNTVHIEANKTLRPYVEGVETAIDRRGFHIPVYSAPAPNTIAKNQRILDKSSDIRNKFVFLDSNRWNKEYNLFMQNVLSFKYVGKNKHDDAPDVLSQTCDVAFRRSMMDTKVFQRPF